jgi:hypothetical protein
MIPYRFRIFEKIAFSLVVMFALGCTTLIAYESNPEPFQASMQYGKDALRWTGEYSMSCAALPNDTCGRLSLE